MSPWTPPDRATIRITNLTLRAIVGANDWEREKRQDIVINISVEFDPRRAVHSDDLADTVDYKNIKRSVIGVVEESSYFLLEKLCHKVLETVMAARGVLAADVTIDKPHALRFADSVSVQMHATREAST